MSDALLDGIHPIVRALSLVWLLPKRALLRRRLTKTVVEPVCGHRICVLPDVFNPVVFRSGRFFAEFLDRDYLPKAGPRQLSIFDLGTGSGVLAVICAARGHRVTATDVNPEAVKCAQVNAAQSGYDHLIDVRHGDLFAPVTGQQFDLILWNPPFFPGLPETLFEISWRSDDAIDRFAATLPVHLKPDGRTLLVWSSQGDTERLLGRLSAHGLMPRVLRQAHFGVERFTIYELRPGVY